MYYETKQIGCFVMQLTDKLAIDLNDSDFFVGKFTSQSKKTIDDVDTVVTSNKTQEELLDMIVNRIKEVFDFNE
ncbi:hypothetical protein DWQ65_02435 [Treponema phagedenis]|uniref:Uncharacterized protein n=2 Tax=Treponema phagedenis TaxID=162 RepID=A0A0B7GXK2_TREPH|nr:hypothetical protein [Treponema phagedenis]EFW39006.1 hypothetical protein HMPREF9554_00482 [Treponema phagedenis F0421]QEK05294.1 hypothetical protein FUT80_00155 [Treponema phagedenis]QSH98951.1 hypothetical protein DWQ65_02435 [Treponema phagedenis]TYT77842.1 hypothetical protein FS559_01210 [Treponema phagedenis]CEM61670.1 conserved hypothetical protein [Treponema phagedenis]